jgi:hypothetical protein
LVSFLSRFISLFFVALLSLLAREPSLSYYSSSPSKITDLLFLRREVSAPVAPFILTMEP